MTLKEFGKNYTGYFQWVNDVIAGEVSAYMRGIPEAYYADIWHALITAYPPKSTPGVFEIRGIYKDLLPEPTNSVYEPTEEEKRKSAKDFKEIIAAGGLSEWHRNRKFGF